MKQKRAQIQFSKNTLQYLYKSFPKRKSIEFSENLVLKNMKTGKNNQNFLIFMDHFVFLGLLIC